MQVKQILQSKNIDTIYSVNASTSVYDAIVLMAEKNIGAVLVIDDGELSGIFSERDYARKIILKGKNSQDTKVGEVMTSKLITVSTSQKIEECMVLMSEKHIRHLPVVDDSKLVGIISINDVVSSIIHEQKQQIASLEGYISGNYA